MLLQSYESATAFDHLKKNLILNACIFPPCLSVQSAPKNSYQLLGTQEVYEIYCLLSITISVDFHFMQSIGVSHILPFPYKTAVFVTAGVQSDESRERTKTLNSERKLKTLVITASGIATMQHVSNLRNNSKLSTVLKSLRIEEKVMCSTGMYKSHCFLLCFYQTATCRSLHRKNSVI